MRRISVTCSPRRQARGRLRQALAALTVTFLTNQAIAEEQALHSLRQAAREFLAQRHLDAPYPVEIEVGKLDPRLRLRRCRGPLQAGDAGRSADYGRTLVQVSCLEPRWKVYVAAKVRGFVDLVVADRALPRGSQVTAADLRLEKRPLERSGQSYYRALEEVIGLETRLGVAPGTALSARQLAPRKLVRRGDAVTLLAEGGGVSVRMRGEALADAGVGRRVQVRNRSSGRVVEGLAVAPGVVAVEF